ncbi:MAG: ABC transporter ATP-binding protein [Lachnospiraceae bacterium]|nr:ABC transporter ATP-binding protein [Lachnospiraceae bacterium]
MKTYLELFRYISNIKKEISLKVLLGLAMAATYVIQAILMADILNLVWQKADVYKLIAPILVVVSIIVIRGALSKCIEGYNKVLAARIKAKIRDSVMDKIYELGPGYMNAKRSGDSISMLQDGIENLEPFFVNYVPQLFVVFLTGISVWVYLVRLDSFSSLLLIISMLMCVFVPMLTLPLINRHVTNYWEEYSRITSEYIDTIQGITTLKILNCERSRGDYLETRANAFCRQSVKNTGISLFNSDLMIILTGATSSLAVISAAVRVNTGAVQPSALAAFMFLAVECARPMIALNNYWHGSFLGMSVARDLFAILKSEPEVKEIQNPVDNGLEAAPEICFENVSFEYIEGTEVLHNITMNIEAGATVAVVGKSGSGKTTLLNLIMRFYDVKSGSIKLSGVDIRDYGLDYLRRNMAVVSQDTYLFYDSILENIRMAKPGASREDVVEAAKVANIHEFIESLPEGYDTLVGERGITLSGGQRQRVAIARAVLQNASILLLDEATSSVDVHSEHHIQEALARVMRDKTTVIVAHRLSTVQDADVIFALENGRLAESGTHRELLEKNGVYASLIKAQEVKE